MKWSDSRSETNNWKCCHRSEWHDIQCIHEALIRFETEHFELRCEFPSDYIWQSLSTECEGIDWILMQPLNGTRTHGTRAVWICIETLYTEYTPLHTREGEAASESENQGLTSMKRMSAKESRSQRCVKIVQCNSNNCIHLLPRFYFFEQYYFLQFSSMSS